MGISGTKKAQPWSEAPFTLTIPQPFDFALTVRKPAGWDWGAPGEVWSHDTLYSTLNLSEDRVVGLSLSADGDKVTVKTSGNGPVMSEGERAVLVERVKAGLGADDDLRSFYSLAGSDKLVRQLRKDLYGLRVGFLNGVFERCLLAITLQMAPLKRSLQMRDCLIDGYGTLVNVDGQKVRSWPTPAVIASADPNQLKQDCKLGYRAKAVHRMAEQILGGFPDILELAAMPEADAFKSLRTLYGVGEYSAQIVSPHRGFPLDVWSSRVFHEILFGTTPADSRGAISKVTDEAKRRWGAHAGHVFVYTLNDLPNLARNYPITRLS